MTYVTVPTLAAQLGIKQDKVLGWIHAGELLAVNCAQQRGGRPRWRIAQGDLEVFLAARRSVPPAKPIPKPRAKQAGVIKFF